MEKWKERNMSVAFKKKEGTRSPVKEGELRRAAGRSLRQKRLDVLFGEFMGPGLAVVALGVLTLLEWVRYFWPFPPRPWLYTALLVVFGVWAAVRMRRADKKVDLLIMAEDGEKLVGQTLEELLRCGYEVFHDIVEEEGNIDHVVVGPGGVLVVETKTRSKPGRGKTEVVYDGEKVSVNGGPGNVEPVIQAKACARAVRKRIKDGTGMDLRVQAVVVYPGWFVKVTTKEAEVWVMNEKYLARKVEKMPQVLEQKDVGLVAGQIRMWAREREKVPE